MEEKFINKYRGKEFRIERYEDGDLYHYLIFVDGNPLEFDEEEVFWSLYKQTETLYSSQDHEIVKLTT